MPKTLILLAAVACAAFTSDALAAGSGVPTLDTAAACHAATDALGDKNQVKNCMDAETRIRKELADNWSRYSASSRSQCSNELAHAYHASYVELISCLEMANPNMMKANAAK